LLFYAPFRAHTWLEPGVDADHLADAQASFYKQRDPEGRVALVLGAGNVASIPVLDVIYKSFVEGAVCALKMSPVNAYLGPYFELALAPLISRGFLRIFYGGAEVGAFLTQHAAVAEMHITGSTETHDRIVWGEAGAEREARKRSATPLFSKPVTSELGNVTPVLVVVFALCVLLAAFYARLAANPKPVLVIRSDGITLIRQRRALRWEDIETMAIEQGQGLYGIERYSLVLQLAPHAVEATEHKSRGLVTTNDDTLTILLELLSPRWDQIARAIHERSGRRPVVPRKYALVPQY